jgi:hypothetical protein
LESGELKMAERFRNYLDREDLPLSTIDDKTGADRLLDRLRAEYREPRVDAASQLLRPPKPRVKPIGAIALSDSQLARVMTAAVPLSPEKRSVLLERIAAHLKLHGHRGCGRCYGDADIEAALASGLQGLAHKSAA